MTCCRSVHERKASRTKRNALPSHSLLASTVWIDRNLERWLRPKDQRLWRSVCLSPRLRMICLPALFCLCLNIQFQSVWCIVLDSTMFASWESAVESFSCKNKCGMIKTAPCTCDARCSFFHNCCEDFQLECPHIFEEYLGLRRQMAPVTLTCDPQTGTFIVNDCPSFQNRSQEDETSTLEPLGGLSSDMDQDPRHAFNSSTGEANVTADEEFVELYGRFQATLPVYDTLTGLVFRNSLVHRCSMRGLNTTAVFWRQEIQVKVYPHLQSLGDTLAVLRGNNSFRLIPPTQYTSDLKGAACMIGVIDSCPPDYTDIAVVEKCGQFFSFIQAFSMGRIFKNYYCIQCNGLPLRNLRPVYDFTKNKDGYDLALLLDLNNNKLAVDISFARRQTQWNVLSCDVDLQSLRTDSVCASRSCGTSAYTARQDDCQTYTSMRLTLMEDGLPLTMVEKNNLGSYAACCLREFLNYTVNEATDDQSKVEVYYNVLSRSVAFDIKVGGLSVKAQQSFPFFEQHVLAVDRMAKLFYIHRLKRHLQGANLFAHGGIYSPAMNLIKTIVGVTEVHLDVMFPDLYQKLYAGSTLQNKPESNETKSLFSDPDIWRHNVSACVCYPPLSSAQHDCSLLACWKTPILKKEFEIGETSESASCLQIFDVSSANRGGPAQWGFPFNFFLLAVLAFLFPISNLFKQ